MLQRDEKIIRPTSLPVKCEYCEKYDAETKSRWEHFQGRNAYYFNVFLIAYNFNTLPRAGGGDDQDPKTMNNLMLLNEIFKQAEDERIRALQRGTVAGMLGV